MRLVATPGFARAYRKLVRRRPALRDSIDNARASDSAVFFNATLSGRTGHASHATSPHYCLARAGDLMAAILVGI